MTRIRALPAAFLLAAVLAPASAGAAVTIGSPLSADATAQAPSGVCMVNPCTYMQSDASLVPQPTYVVPLNIPNGVITGWAFKASSGANTLQVLRASAGGTLYTAVGQSAPVAAQGANTIATAPARIPVHSGDTIGLDNDSNALVMSTSTLGFPAASVVRAFDPAVGATPVAPSSSSPHSQLELQATIEPDADGDGFGDETQDQCPTDPKLQTPCSADLQVRITAEPATLQAGQIAGYAITVRNAGTSTAPNAALALGLPPGVALGSLSSTVGSCGGTSCSLGTLADGATVNLAASALTTASGPLTVTATATSTVADPDPADNSASVTTTVLPPDLTLTQVSVFPHIFRRGSKLPYLSATHAPTPSAIKFTLSEAARVRFTFTRIGPRNHALSSQSYSVSAAAGDDRIVFAGVLPNHHHLAIAQYRLVASAQTADGRRASAKSVRFTVHAAKH